MGFTDRSSTIIPSREQQLRRRRRRQGATFAGLLLLVVLVATAAFGNWQGWWNLGPAPAALAVCPTQIAGAPGDTYVHVYNGTRRRGLAGAVAGELQNRSFKVLTIATQEQSKALTATILIRYGPGDEIFAHTMAAQFSGTVTSVVGTKVRKDHSIDVVIGDRYKAMRPRSQAAAAIAPIPAPRRCVDATTPVTPPATIATGAVS